MSDGNPLDRPATDEEIAEVERLLSATAEIVPLRRTPPKVSTEVLALPVLPPIPAEPARGAVVLSFLQPTTEAAVWLRPQDRRPPGWIHEGDRPWSPPKSRRGDHGWVFGLEEDD